MDWGNLKKDAGWDRRAMKNALEVDKYTDIQNCDWKIKMEETTWENMVF
jgi:hypothetical protein